MMTAFTYKILHLMQANATFTNYDAKACYVRIMAILTSLAEYKAGLPDEACIQPVSQNTKTNEIHNDHCLWSIRNHQSTYTQ
eukprot:6696392-Ditylum_brightwellii.AAC.1